MFGLLVMLGCGWASAQTFPPATFRIAGFPVGCGNAWTVVGPGVGDIARAVPAMAGYPPRIWIDPSYYSLPAPVQFFIYGHECGHHIVGMNEDAADCWAARTGRHQGWFTTTTMQYLIQAFQWNPGDWTHAPGPVRLQRIWNCFTNG
jgi:hypothetical protein